MKPHCVASNSLLMKEANLQPLTGRLRSSGERPLFTSPLGALPFLRGFLHFAFGFLQFRVFGVVALDPTGCAVSLALKVHEVSRCAVHLAGEAVPEAVKLRHDYRCPLEQLAYEFDSPRLTYRRVRCVSGKHSPE